MKKYVKKDKVTGDITLELIDNKVKVQFNLSSMSEFVGFTKLKEIGKGIIFKSSKLEKIRTKEINEHMFIPYKELNVIKGWFSSKLFDPSDREGIKEYMDQAQEDVLYIKSRWNEYADTIKVAAQIQKILDRDNETIFEDLIYDLEDENVELEVNPLTEIDLSNFTVKRSQNGDIWLKPRG